MVRHRIAGKKLSRPTAQRVAMLRILACELIRHGRITTTQAKASEARKLAEQLITYGKKGTLHHRRLALSRVPNNEAVAKVFDELAVRYADRDGGYTRLIKIGNRKGDAAPMTLIELV